MTLHEFVTICAGLALTIFCVIGSFWFGHHGAW